MATTKVRRVRVGTRLSVELRARLTKYCAASGISERTIIEDALRKYLDSTDDMALLLRRFDRVERALARDHRDLELLSEAFGRYMRLWFMAHAPNAVEAGKAAARGVAETQYKQFAQHLGAQFTQGHRFIDDLPVEAFAGENNDK
jgi:predicted DNA-binding protein